MSENVLKWDIKSGIFPYHFYDKLIKVIQDNKDDIVAVYDKVFDVLHPGVKFNKRYKENIKYLNDVVDGLTYWNKQLETKLKGEPTQDEIDAGVDRFRKEVGRLGIIIPLCKEFKIRPNDLMEWDFAEIFGILFYDSRQAAYQKRLLQVHERKNKTKSKRR